MGDTYLGIFIMIFLVFFKIVSARIGEESLIQSIGFRKNGVEISAPVYPPFASWDSKYTGLFDIGVGDKLEIKATSMYPYPQLYLSVNDEQWLGLANETYTTVLLTKQENVVNVFSTFYNKYHVYVNYTYEFKIFINSFSINASFQSTNFTFSGSKRDNNCTQVHNSSETWLNLTINTVPQGVITIRRLSYVSSDDYSSVTQGTLFTYSDFFTNLLENVLEVTVSNSSAKQIFVFRFHKSPGMYDIYYHGAVADSMDFYGWDLMPRFHPEVFNYTLVRKLPSAAFGSLKFVIKTGYVSVCFLNINPGSPLSKYTWTTDKSTYGIRVYIKEDDFKFYCASPGLERYTKNYTIAYYRKSNNVLLNPISGFINPLVEVNGSFKSNSSELPDGLNYKYDLSKLNTWDELKQFKIPNYENRLYYKGFFRLTTFDPIEYPKQPAGVSLFMTPVDPDGYFTYTLKGSLKNSDYFYSSKSIYPLVPGNNSVIVNFTAEDRSYTLDYIFTIPVLNPDTTVKYLFVNETFEGLKSLESGKSEINAFVMYEQLNVTLEAELNNSNAIYEVIYKNLTIFGGNSKINCTLQIDKTNETNVFILRVYAESRSWVQDYIINLAHLNDCGDGRRWGELEDCDDGNSIELDGCFDCRVEVNWTCTGGSFINSDNCTELKFNTTGPPLKNTTDQPLNTTDEPTNTTDQPSNKTDQPTNQTDQNVNNTANDTDVPANDSSESNETDNPESSSEESEPNQGGESESSETNDPESSSEESSPKQDESSSNNDESSGLNDFNISDKSSVLVYEAGIDPFDKDVPYFYIVLCITGIIGAAHLCSKIVNKRIVQEFSTGGVNMAFIPMIWTFQSFYMIGCLNRTPYLSFFNSFSWSLHLIIPKKFKDYNLVFYLIIALSITSLLLIIYSSVKCTKHFYGRKTMKKIVNYSAFIHFFKLFSPILLYSSLQYLLTNPDPTHNPIQLFLSISFILLIIISQIYFSYLCIANKRNLYDQKLAKKYEAFCQGLSIIYKILPIDSRKELTKLDLGITSQQNDLDKKLRKRKSVEFKVQEEKPKFFSCPWKQAKCLDESIEIPEFDLCEPLEEVITDKTSPCTVVKVPLYYVYSMKLYFMQVTCLALTKDIENFIYILIVVRVIETLFYIWKNPFAIRLYNRFYVVTNFTHAVMLLVISIINSSPLCMSIITLILGLSLVFSFWWLNIYELIFILKKSKHFFSRSKKSKISSMNHNLEPNESSKIVEQPQNEIFYTEPIQTMREHPVRNCLSFIQPDIQEI